ncbi:MAG: lipoyl(octanoyl) transferase LipB [Bdellovibrionaceae bacterium]|nr:lipoyl(octanoyl) transferase LipB [Bdellovibrio sp.]
MILFEDWGLIDYESALKKQIEYVEIVAANEAHPGFLIFCTHPAVVTLGRQTKPEDVFAWKGPVIEISRGGRATYHGPSQLVAYPILNLKNSRAGRGPQEVRGYLRDFEKAIVETLKEFGIDAIGKTPQKVPGEIAESDETGVWVGTRKIASLGIAVKKWVCFHGAAINLFQDAEAFQGMNPCGFKSSTMVSLEELLGQPPPLEKFKETLRKHCSQFL